MVVCRKEDCDNDRETSATPGYGPLKVLTSNKNLCTFSRISIKTDASFRKIQKNIYFSKKEKRKTFRKKKEKIDLQNPIPAGWLAARCIKTRFQPTRPFSTTKRLPYEDIVGQISSEPARSRYVEISPVPATYPSRSVENLRDAEYFDQIRPGFGQTRRVSARYPPLRL